MSDIIAAAQADVDRVEVTQPDPQGARAEQFAPLGVGVFPVVVEVVR